jgi:hypothetical protein
MPRSPKKKLTVKDLMNMDVSIYTKNDKIIIIKDKKLAKAYEKEVTKNVRKELAKHVPWAKNYY